MRVSGKGRVRNYGANLPAAGARHGGGQSRKRYVIDLKVFI
jgi:hypothetical protein